jgi:hypothetical protein
VQFKENEDRDGEDEVNAGSPVTEMSFTAAAAVTDSIEMVSTSGRLHAALDTAMCALAAA